MAVTQVIRVTGAASEEMAVAAIPRISSVPTILNVSTSEVTIDADLATATDQPILYTRICLDASDDLTAASALLTGVGCKTLLPGERRTFTLGFNAQRVYAIGVGSAAEPADYTGGAGIMSIAEDDVADVQAQMFVFDFNTLEQVKTFSMAMTETYNSGLTARLLVEAESHA